MMHNDIPEEKLLEMMRPDEQKESSASGARGLGGAFSGILAKVPVTGLLQVFIFLSLVVLAVEIVFPRFPFAAAFTEEKDKTQWLPVTGGLQTPPLEDYIEEVRRVNIFGSAFSDSAGIMLNGIKDLVLAGIVFEDPAQAILKNTKNGSLLYLQAGESVEGIKVLEINEDRIVVEYQAETFEMRL